MRIVSYRQQRTLAGPVEVSGIGFLTGSIIRVRFVPAPASSGIVFVRTDLRPKIAIPADVSQVTGTARRTTLGPGSQSVGLVEHVLSALAGLRIDNCRVELAGAEPPGLDGSAAGFVQALRSAGAQEQDAPRPIYAVDQPITVTRPGATLTLHPPTGSELCISYFLDYGPWTPPGRQTFTSVITPSSFVSQIADCRTFILESEAEELRRQGLGKRTTAADLLVFGPQGPINNRLRFANEPARHKVLDLVGDLSLFGADLWGHVVAFRSGHPLNIELVRAMRQVVAPARDRFCLAA